MAPGPPGYNFNLNFAKIVGQIWESISKKLISYINSRSTAPAAHIIMSLGQDVPAALLLKQTRVLAWSGQPERAYRQSAMSKLPNFMRLLLND